MIVRALVTLFATLLLIGALSSILAPRELRSGRGAQSLAADAARADEPPAAALPVTASVPSKAPIEARLGEVVTIDATSATDDLVDLPDLGIDAPVGPDLPAQLQLVADTPGTFPIVLRYSGKRVGTLVVTARGDGEDDAAAEQPQARAQPAG